MDYSNCAENFTSTNGSCQVFLEIIRGISASQVENLLRSSILLSIETGLYSKFEVCLFRGKVRLTFIVISLVRVLVCNVDVHTMASGIVDSRQTMIDIKYVRRFSSKGILLKANLAMWLATLVMFIGSTAHYSVNWVQTLNVNAVQQSGVDAEWDLFYDNQSDLASFPPEDLGLTPALQYLPIINVSPLCRVTVWRRLQGYLHHAFVRSIY